MRARPLVLTLWLLAGGAFLAAAPPGHADTKKPGDKAETKKAGDILNVQGELTKDDPKDTVRKASHAKTYDVKLAADKMYQIDMMSRQIDSYLRLEDPDGKQVAEDDDSGGFPNARIIYKAPKTGTYKVIATTFPPGATGKFTLTVKEASGAALAVAKLDKEFMERAGKLRKEYAAAKTQADKDRIEAQFYEAVAANVEGWAKIAEQFPEDPLAKQAEIKVRQGIQGLASAASPAITKMLRAMRRKTTQKELKMQISVALGQSLRNQYEKAYQKNEKAEAAKLAKESEETLKQVVKDSGETGPLAKQAKDALFLLEHLSVGKKAPNIAGQDMDGKKFKLSDYRGKVVVVDFWAFW
jgi:hypothetical protein